MNVLLDFNLMKDFKETTPEYRILKRYWNLIVRPLNNIKSFESYNPIQKTKTSSDTIINDWIENLRVFNCKEFKDLASMFSNWKLEIINSL